MHIRRRKSRFWRRFLKSRIWALGAVATVIVLVASVTLTLVLARPASTETMLDLIDRGDAAVYQERPAPAAREVAAHSYKLEMFRPDSDGRLFYADETVETFAGVDVSSHQERIDWDAVKGAGIDFAMLRVGFRGASKGNMFIDNTFVYNVNRADEAGLDIGIYFFSQAISAEEARAEAELVIKLIKGYNISYPVVFDWEFQPELKNPRTENVTGETMTECAVAFCNTIYQAGYTPMVYFNLHQASDYYDLGRISAFDFWLAEHSEQAPSFAYNFAIYQYSHNGRVPGISEPVDLNISFVNYAGRK